MVRLEGGPFDGLSGDLAQTPPLIGVYICEGCGGLHIEAGGGRGDRYRWAGCDGEGTLYRFADGDGDGLERFAEDGAGLVAA